METKSSNLLSTSSFLINNMNRAISTAGSFPTTNAAWTTNASMYTNPLHFLATPPPEANRGLPPSGYPYTWDYDVPGMAISTIAPTTMANTQTFVQTDGYLKGTSLEDSPISSPGSCDSASSCYGLHEQQQQLPPADEMSYTPPVNQTSIPSSMAGNFQSPLCNNVYGIPGTNGTPAVFEHTTTSFGQGGVENDLGMNVSKGVRWPISKLLHKQCSLTVLVIIILAFSQEKEAYSCGSSSMLC